MEAIMNDNKQRYHELMDRLVPTLNLTCVSRTPEGWVVQSGQEDSSFAHCLGATAIILTVERENWTVEEMLKWFERPSKDLEGKTPVSYLKAKTWLNVPLLRDAARNAA